MGNKYYRKPIQYEVNENGCWICTSHSKTKEGYPRIRVEGKLILLNRHVLEERLNRDIKSGFCACHKCNNPSCINPDHIYEGMHWHNTRDSLNSGTFHFNHGSGEANPGSKLTKLQVDEIRNSILSSRQLAKLYGVSQSCIMGILTNKTWKNV